MGCFSSKKLPAHNDPFFDSVVLCDGQRKMREVKSPAEAAALTGKSQVHNPWYAGSNCGRFIYMLGNQSATPLTGDDSVTTFDLDIVDLFLSKRTRIKNIGDFFNYGLTTGFYHLADHNLVIVDFDPVASTLRQRLIQIDLSDETASCPFYRGYEIDGLFTQYANDLVITARTSIGEDLAITVVPDMDLESHGVCLRGRSVDRPGIVYPLNPLSQRGAQIITEQIDQANEYIAAHYPVGNEGPAYVCTIHPPFFISKHEVGFFIYPNNLIDATLIDPMTVLVMNLATDEIAIRKATSKVSFEKKPFFASWKQANYGEVAMTYRFQRPPKWWRKSAFALMRKLDMPLRNLCSYLERNRYGRLYTIVTAVSLANGKLHYHLRQTQQTDLTILNTESFEWTEIGRVDEGSYQCLGLVALKNGHFILASQVKESGESRLIGGENVKSSEEKFRLIRSPHSLSSLSHLASIAVRKMERVPSELMEQLVERFM